jgi:hypothetical protein
MQALFSILFIAATADRHGTNARRLPPRQKPRRGRENIFYALNSSHFNPIAR